MTRQRWFSLRMRTWSSSSRRSVPAKRSAKAFMSGARIAVRTTRTPDDLNTPAKRAPSFVSWSQMTTCGASSMVLFLACCAHHSSVGAYVTAAWRIVRRRRSRKKSTNTSRNRMSNVHAVRVRGSLVFAVGRVRELNRPSVRVRRATLAHHDSCTRPCKRCSSTLAASREHKDFGQPVVSDAVAVPEHQADDDRRLSPAQAAARFQIPEYLLRKACTEGRSASKP